MIDKDTSVIVVSCDKYSDLWVPFFNIFRKFWTDVPFPVYLISNHKRFDDTEVQSILVGDDTSWSKNLAKALGKINTPYVIPILEDFFLLAPVDTEKIKKCIGILKEMNGKMLRLAANPKPDKPLPAYSFLGTIEVKSPYRVSTQVSVWKKESLLSIIRENENIWEFELKGTERSRAEVDGYYSVWNSLVVYRHVIERGKWFPGAAKKYKAMNIGCDFSMREVMTPAEYRKFYISMLLSYPKRLFPWEFRQKVKKFLSSNL